jgi:hypothetical protein
LSWTTVAETVEASADSNDTDGTGGGGQSFPDDI